MKANTIQIKLCCGCGNVNLKLGSVTIKLTKVDLKELSLAIDKVIDDLESGSSVECSPNLFADRKFFA